MINKNFESVLDYIGFPASAKKKLYQNPGCAKSYTVNISFTFLAKENVDKTVNSLKSVVDGFYSELIKSDPVQNIIDKKDLKISTLETELEHIQKEIERLEKFEIHHKLAMELK